MLRVLDDGSHLVTRQVELLARIGLAPADIPRSPSDTGVDGDED